MRSFLWRIEKLECQAARSGDVLAEASLSTQLTPNGGDYKLCAYNGTKAQDCKEELTRAWAHGKDSWMDREVYNWVTWSSKKDRRKNEALKFLEKLVAEIGEVSGGR